MNHWWIGVLLHFAGFAVTGLIVAVFSAIPATNEAAMGAAAVLTLGCGLVQLLWVLPLVVFAAVKGHKQLIWGLTIPAALVFLLNTACWGVVGGMSF